MHVVNQKHSTKFFTNPKGLSQLSQSVLGLREGDGFNKIWHILEFQEVTGGQYLSKALISDGLDFWPEVIEYIAREVTHLGKPSIASNRVQMKVLLV